MEAWRFGCDTAGMELSDASRLKSCALCMVICSRREHKPTLIAQIGDRSWNYTMFMRATPQKRLIRRTVLARMGLVTLKNVIENIVSTINGTF